MLGFSAFGQYRLPICFLNYLFHNLFSWCADGHVCAKENQWNLWHNEMMTILLSLETLELLVCAFLHHYCDVIMGANASQITSLTVVYSIVYSHADKKKQSNLCVTGLCAGNSPETGEFPAQMASYTENVSIYDVIMNPESVSMSWRLAYFD